MKISRIILSNFTEAHASLDLALPDRGVVLVVGPNGSGKSAIIEAVAEGLFGKTLRGTSPWVADCAGFVRLECDESLVLERGISKGGRKRLQIGDDAKRYDTVTKAQAALQHVVGTFDEWKRSFTFSSSDAAHFTGATDAERKRLLESLLGLSRFDEGSKQCREDLRDAKKRLDTATSAENLLGVQIDATSLAISRAEQSLENLPGEPTSPDRSADLPELRRQHKEAVEAYGNLATRIAEHTADLVAARRDLDRLAAGQCSSCGRDFEAGDLDVARDRVAELEATMPTGLQESKEQADRCQQVLTSAEKEQTTYEAQEAAYRSVREERVRLIGIVGQERSSLATKGAKLAEARHDKEQAASRVDLLTDVSEVLSVRGARALILTRALAGLEEIANSWLARFPVDGGRVLQVGLQGSDSKIVLSVEGAGGGKGYQACSSGQRKRIDAAIMMALSEISCAANARGGGTLFMDEVLDGLDTAGMSSMCEAINELAADRCVVVISHRDVGQSLRVTRTVALQGQRG